MTTITHGPAPVLVLTPVPGPSSSGRIECTGCPARLVVSGLSADTLQLLVSAAELAHKCETV